MENRGRALIRACALALVAIVSATALALAPVTAPAASAADLSQFQAGNIIDDATFFNPYTMSVADVQAFLNAKVPTCAQHYVCLKDYSETTRDLAATPMCTAYHGVVNESAASIIVNVGRACGINPQVILVTLQKEQALVTDTWPKPIEYQSAMGAGCPDTAACDANYYGFFNQVHFGAYLLKRYTQPAGTGPGTQWDTRFDLWYPVGQVSSVQYNPDLSCGSLPVLISNYATHSLYIYTPYTPNANSLAAGYAQSSDPCASYGNRNFYNIFTDWFGAGRASVSGLVTGEDGAPLAEVAVHARNSVGAIVGQAYTNSSGGFLLSHLVAGTYSIEFDHGPNLAYVSQWLTNAPDQASSTPIAIAAGQAITGVNAVLPKPLFADVAPNSGFYPDVQWMATAGISSGTAQPSGLPLYKPVDAVSRQAMAIFLLRFSGQSFTPPAEQTFADVPHESPFYTAVEWMAAQGISTGTAQPAGKPLFKPVDAVSRQAMALFLARYKGIDTTTPPGAQSFADVAVTDPAAAAIGWMSQTGISTGTVQPSGLPLYKPVDPVSRQAMAAFLHRLFGL
jgi:hypothetical protein